MSVKFFSPDDSVLFVLSRVQSGIEPQKCSSTTKSITFFESITNACEELIASSIVLREVQGCVSMKDVCSLMQLFGGVSDVDIVADELKETLTIIVYFADEDSASSAYGKFILWKQCTISNDWEVWYL